MADLALLATLKDQLIHADDFSSVTRYFFDHFGEDPSFLDLGEPIRHPFLEAVVTQVAAQVFESMKQGFVKTANRLRAEGQQQAATVRATADRHRTEILAKAEAEAQRAIQLDPKSGPALLALGNIQLATKRLSEADQTFQRLAALPDPQYRPLHAYFLYATGRKEQARGEFERLAGQSEPTFQAGQLLLASAFLGQIRRKTDPFDIGRRRTKRHQRVLIRKSSNDAVVTRIAPRTGTDDLNAQLSGKGKGFLHELVERLFEG